MSTSDLLSATSGAFQASIAVLLTIFTGVFAAQYKLLDGQSATLISKICVRIFMPALLITNVGAELHPDTALRYVPILSKWPFNYQLDLARWLTGPRFIVWSFVYTLLSLLIGRVAVRLFKLPQWVIPAVCFNNTTSLPLLLVQSLDATGVLSTLLIGDESSADAIRRAKSYFLVCSIVGNSLTFALGPRLMDSENAPDKDSPDQKDDEEREQQRNHDDNGQIDECDDSNEQTSLLPRVLRDTHNQVSSHGYHHSKRYWDRLDPTSQWYLGVLADFFNAPLIGAVIGAVLGLTPILHRWFFNNQAEGGVFNAWLTTPLSNIGSLFATLQTIVVGVTLSSSLRKLKRGEHSGHVPSGATLFILLMRFIIWPAVSIVIIWILATKTDVLSRDPILWFSMMLMPTGPTAMKLMALAEVNGAGEEEKMATSKLLAISYAITPLICLTVVGALKASQAAL